jgi:hypothetical protein
MVFLLCGLFGAACMAVAAVVLSEGYAFHAVCTSVLFLLALMCVGCYSDASCYAVDVVMYLPGQVASNMWYAFRCALSVSWGVNCAQPEHQECGYAVRPSPVLATAKALVLWLAAALAISIHAVAASECEGG